MNDQPIDSSYSLSIQQSTSQQKMSVLKPILLTLLMSAVVFGLSGYYLGKTFSGLNSSKIVQTQSSETVFSQTQRPDPNALYRGTVKVQANASQIEENIDVVFLTNWMQSYAAGIPDDPFTGKLYGRKTYSNGSEKIIDTYSDFRKIEKPTKLVSFGDKLVNKLFDALVSNADSKIYILVRIDSETLGDGKPKYALFEINTINSDLREIWSYDLQIDTLKLGLNELAPSFGKITNKYLAFSMGGYFNSWEGRNVVLNLETGIVKYLPKSVEVKVDVDNNTVSYKPVGKLEVKYNPGGGYTPEQVALIEAATSQTVTELLP